MTLTDRPIAPASPSGITEVDTSRWPALAKPASAPFRSAVAKAVLARVARSAGIRVVFPNGKSLGPSHGPQLLVKEADAFLTRLGRDGKIGFGESYMAGEWEAPDLEAVLEPLAKNVRSLIPQRLQWIRRFYEPRPPAEEDNDLVGAQRNISAHYDLSNELFSLFLDETMTYSSALFDSFDEPLVQAQRRKIDRLLDAASIKAGSRVLEIGTGWGELALRAAKRGAQVTTLTLSREQATLARQRVADAGFGSSVDVRVQDYREVDGSYDAVVSVEMIEAVGERWWPTYFETLERRLAPGGRVGLQAILMRHDTMEAAKRSWTWIHKYIFPGGIIPSLEAIEATVSRHTRLKPLSRHHFGLSYAHTLRVWRERFDQREAEVDRLGFDKVFRRMWDFYLAYSEAGFRSGHLDVAQFVFAKEPF